MSKPTIAELQKEIEALKRQIDDKISEMQKQEDEINRLNQLTDVMRIQIARSLKIDGTISSVTTAVRSVLRNMPMAEAALAIKTIREEFVDAHKDYHTEIMKEAKRTEDALAIV